MTATHCYNLKLDLSWLPHSLHPQAGSVMTTTATPQAGSVMAATHSHNLKLDLHDCHSPLHPKLDLS
ncbi:hypothetical protein Hamer_G026321 [Homarus americanus]|uniref:Uncharacterized protein n=1 Tax=Homarus americanus TaxID=6706 RepID=A0A8J5JEN4_HOMAM|nr:hypothetical protein Hamer_G026321 [Homarus americanus]